MLSVSKNEWIWENKYRPQSIEEAILPKKDKEKFADIIKKGRVGNLLLISSESGTGKTTVAKILAQGHSSIFYNTADVNINKLRTDIRRFASTRSLEDTDKEGKIVILDEFDRAGKDLQKALRSFIEEYSSNCTFILTANYGANLINAIKNSRFTEIEFSNPVEEKKDLMKQMIIRALKILKNENVESTDTTKRIVAALVKKRFPDYRAVVRDMEFNVIDGKLNESVLDEKNEDDEFDSLFDMLKGKKFKEAREFVPTISHDYNKFITAFYKTCLRRVKPSSMPTVIGEIYDNNKTAAQAANMEIHIAGLLVFIMMEAEFT